jgi:hypothetical protein
MSLQNIDFAKMVERLESLEQRNERLERQARWMKMGAMLLLISFGVVFGVGAAQDRGEVRAKRFVLEAPDSDKIRGEFVVGKEGETTLNLLDADERLCVLLLAHNKISAVSCSQHRPGFAVDAKKRSEASMFVVRDQNVQISKPSILLMSSDGKRREIRPEEPR